MSTRKFIFAALAAVATCAAVPASAADLGYGYGSLKDVPDDDPRYSDVYRHPAPPPPRYAAPYPPPAPVYPAPPAPYYAGPPPRVYDGYAGRPDCLPRHVISSRLESRGWLDLHDLQVSGDVAHARARRPNGRIFDLTVDRCTGEVLQADLIDGRQAYAPGYPPPQDYRYRNDRYGY
jgi:hypothetical protein